MDGMSAAQLTRLIQRIDAIPLFAHAYSHHLNLRFGGATPFDLLTFAAANRLAGLKIHVDDGEEQSLLNMQKSEKAAFADSAKNLQLALHVETSSTAREHLESAVAIARDIAATSIRCYPRYEGKVSQIITRTIDDLKALRQLDREGRFLFTLEQHEDLKSHELMEIVHAVANPKLTLLFDFGNMLNAYENPADALAIQSQMVTEVHIKDVRILDDRGGWAHVACRSGEGEINFHRMLRDLLMLGNENAQVTAFALEEECGMYAPAYRFPDEPADPFIPARAASTTDLPVGESLENRLRCERDDAGRQVCYVRAVLAELRVLACARLELYFEPNVTTGETGHP